VLVDDEAEGAGEVGFEGGDVDLAVALSGVAVAGLEEGAFGGDWDVKGGAGDELLVIHVAGVGVGRRAVDAGGAGGGDAHGAEEGVEREVDARGEVGEHALAIEGDDARAAVRELLREEAAAQAEAVAGKAGVDVDLEDLHFEDVAGFGLLDGDGSGEDVAARAFVLNLVVDGLGVRRNVGLFDAEGLQAISRPAGGEGLHGDGVAGVDGEHRLRGSGVVAPGYGGGGGFEGEVGGEGGSREDEEAGGDEGSGQVCGPLSLGWLEDTSRE